MNDLAREAFEQWYLREIDGDPEELATEVDGEYFFHVPRTAWRAWQAALSANGGEAVPVGYTGSGSLDAMKQGAEGHIFPSPAPSHPIPLYLGPTVKESLTVQSEPIGYADPDTLADYRAGDRLHIPVYRPDASAEWQNGIPVYTHPAPPSVAVPDAVKKALKCFDIARFEGWDSALAEGNSPALRDIYKRRISWAEKYLQEMLTATPSPDHSGDANKMVDVECCCGETEDAWRLCPSHGPNHIAAAGKVVPIGYLTNQAVARLQSDKRLNGEHLYAFKPDDLSKFQAVCLAPTVNESLTIEDFNGMCRIVEAVSQMTDGFAIDQCHMDRAREIVQDATRLRTAGDEGEGA